MYLRFENFSGLPLTTPMITKLEEKAKKSSLSSELIQLFHVRLCKESPRDRLQSRRETESAE